MVKIILSELKFVVTKPPYEKGQAALCLVEEPRYYNSFDLDETERLRDFLNTNFPKKEAKENEH
jgi:hypothetical protein